MGKTLRAYLLLTVALVVGLAVDARAANDLIRSSVASLPTSGPTGMSRIVTDGVDGGDCGTGGGSVAVLCVFDGDSTWIPGGGGEGGSGAPTGATYLVQTAHGSLSQEQALGSLESGMLSVTTTTGVVAARTLTGTANQITVTNGNGLSGNPTFAITTNPTLPGTTSGTFVGNLTGTVTGPVVGNASTATAFAANPANCNAGSGARGVDASGVGENCTDFMEEPSGTGIVARTAANTAANRTITGTAGQIDVTNGNGVSGNPTIALPTNIDLTGKTLELPNDTANPATCSIGQIHFDNNATAGANLYGCTASNTWTLLGDGGGGGASAAGAAGAVQTSDGAGVLVDSGCTAALGELTCENGLNTGADGTVGALTFLEGVSPGAGENTDEHTLYIGTDNVIHTHENGGSDKVYLTAADTQTVTGKTLNCSSGTGNICTIWERRGGDLVGLADASTVGHIWDFDPLSTTCAPLAVTGTNQSYGACTFADSDGEYGRQLSFDVPTGGIASMNADIWWKTTGTGNARFRVQTLCYASDAAGDSAYSNSTYVTAAAGTSARLVRVNMPSIVITGCDAGERMAVRFSRNRTEGSDTLNAALDVARVFFNIEVAQ